MNYEKIARVIRALSRSAAAGATSWRKLDSQTAYEAEFAQYAVRISAEQTEDANASPSKYKLEIIKDDRVIETVTSDQLKAALPASAFILREMYDAARKKALGVEDVLDEILQSLKAFDR
jgi:hypothetical protein